MTVAAARAAVLARLRGPAVVPFLATRAILLWFAWWTLHAVPLDAPPWQAFPHNLLLDGWLRWDSGWYLSIATEGYKIAAGGGEANVAFFPLYPIAAYLASFPFRPFFEARQAVAAGGLAVSQVAFFVALRGIHRLAVRRLDPAAADRAVWLVALFPFSVFMSAFYSEALFLALAAWAFVFADDGRWGRAAALAALAVLTRIPGLLLVVALVIQALGRKDARPRDVVRQAWPLAVAPLALVALMVHHAARFGDALVMFHIRGAGWHKPPGLHTLVQDAWGLLFVAGEVRCTGIAACLANPNAAHLVVGAMNMVALAAAIVLAVAAARRFGLGLGFFALGSVAASLVNGVEGSGRVISTLFPIFLLVAAWASDRALFRFLCALSFPFLLLLTFYFSHWLHLT